MILVESAVCAAMKRDVKESGYTAFGIQMEGEPWLGLKGGDWIVLAELKNMPRKVLSQLVEHAGDIPRNRECWSIQKPKKGDVQRQDTMFSLVEQEISDLLDTDWDQTAKLGRTGMTLDGYGLWQNRENLSVLRLAPQMEAMAEWNGKASEDGGWVCKAGLVSWCFVLKTLWRGEHEVWRKHLEKMSWVG